MKLQKEEVSIRRDAIEKESGKLEIPILERQRIYVQWSILEVLCEIRDALEKR